MRDVKVMTTAKYEWMEPAEARSQIQQLSIQTAHESKTSMAPTRATKGKDKLSAIIFAVSGNRETMQMTPSS